MLHHISYIGCSAVHNILFKSLYVAYGFRDQRIIQFQVNMYANVFCCGRDSVYTIRTVCCCYLVGYIFDCLLPIGCSLPGYIFDCLLPIGCYLVGCIFDSLLPIGCYLLGYIFDCLLPIGCYLLRYIFDCLLPIGCCLLGYIFDCFSTYWLLPTGIHL